MFKIREGKFFGKFLEVLLTRVREFFNSSALENSGGKIVGVKLSRISFSSRYCAIRTIDPMITFVLECIRSWYNFRLDQIPVRL